MSPRNIDGIFTDVLMKEMQDGMGWTNTVFLVKSLDTLIAYIFGTIIPGS